MTDIDRVVAFARKGRLGTEFDRSSILYRKRNFALDSGLFNISRCKSDPAFHSCTKLHMDDPPHSVHETPEDTSESQRDWQRRLRQFGIDPDEDPIDILIQLSERLQKLNEKT